MRKKILLGLIILLMSFTMIVSGCSKNPILGSWETTDYRKENWTFNENMTIIAKYDVKVDGNLQPPGPPEIPVSGNIEKSTLNSTMNSGSDSATYDAANGVNHITKNYTYSIDTTKNPYWIDIIVQDQSLRSEALYRFTNNNEMLEISINRYDKNRPASFDKGEIVRFKRLSNR